MWEKMIYFKRIYITVILCNTGTYLDIVENTGSVTVRNIFSRYPSSSLLLEFRYKTKFRQCANDKNTLN